MEQTALLYILSRKEANMTHPVCTVPVISAETLEQFAWTNLSFLNETPSGVVLIFHGLNFVNLRSECSAFEIYCAQHHLLTLFPYYGPWSWMNDDAVRCVDEVVDAAFERFHLDASTPVIASGNSMGGLSSLVYTRYARRTPKACFANCPVCDLPYHATERPDLPRTVYTAFSGAPCGLEEALRQHSPLHLAEDMPRIPYYIVHGTADTAVNKQMHSDRFVAAMHENHHELIYREVEGMRHCAFADAPEEEKLWNEAIVKAVIR